MHPGHHVQLAADVRWQVHPFGGDQLVRPGGGACNWGGDMNIYLFEISGTELLRLERLIIAWQISMTSCKV